MITQKSSSKTLLCTSYPRVKLLLACNWALKIMGMFYHQAVKQSSIILGDGSELYKEFTVLE